MRYRLLLVACLYLSVSASASAHTSVGGGSSGPEDPNADCLRWEVVPLTTDAGLPDGAAADAGRTDAGSSGVTVLRCAEHATMFGCACAVGSPRDGRDGTTTTAFAMAALAALVMGARLARRRSGR
jgi:MYXO-CTERM domain-containing protein